MIFTTFADTDRTAVKLAEVKSGMFSPNDTGSLSQMYTSPAQIGVSGMYYYDVYHDSPPPGEGEIQFSIAYGHINGLGSPTLTERPSSVNPTKVIYSQYRNMLLPSGSKFKFGEDFSDDIYVINFSRARMKQSIDAGNWEFTLSGSKGTFTFADDSGLGETVVGDSLASNVYNVRVGTSGTPATGAIVGLIYPDNGIIVLSPTLIDAVVGFATSAENYVENPSQIQTPFKPWLGPIASGKYQYAHEGLYRSMKLATDAGLRFKARSVEQVTSQNYFVRVPNGKYNYTSNPSFYRTVNGQRRPLAVFEEVPLTYPTTVGLYNGANELVAVAKLSRPLQKTDERELLIRVRLDY